LYLLLLSFIKYKGCIAPFAAYSKILIVTFGLAIHTWHKQPAAIDAEYGALAGVTDAYLGGYIVT
jgi:hypothetical protein